MTDDEIIEEFTHMNESSLLGAGVRFKIAENYEALSRLIALARIGASVKPPDTRLSLSRLGTIIAAAQAMMDEITTTPEQNP